MYTFIVNPRSRSGQGQKIWQDIEQYLLLEKIPYTVHFTKYQYHASKLTRTVTADSNKHTIIVLGGDGTINEVLNGISDFDQVTLGYIPTGSSNDFARSHHLLGDPVMTMKQIHNHPKTISLDVGTLHYADKKRYFMVSTGIGFDAAVCHQAAVSKIKVFLNRLKLGKLTYLGIALNRLFYSSPQTISLALDDQPAMRFDRAYFAAVMNHKYEGGGFKFCPQADPQDQLLDVIIVNHLSKLQVLGVLPTAFSGHHVRFNGVHIFTCKKAVLKTDPSLPVHTDGEPVFLKKQIEVSLAPQQIKVLVGD